MPKKMEWEPFGTVTTHVFPEDSKTGTLACLQSMGQPGRDHVNIKLKKDGTVEVIFWFEEAIRDDSVEDGFIKRRCSESTIVARSPKFAARVRKSDSILKRFYDWLNDRTRRPGEKPPRGPIKEK